jgi:CBS domain-containing membrane protein
MQMGYSFALVPVLLNSAILTATALIFNNLSERYFPPVARLQLRPNSPIISLATVDINDAFTKSGEALDARREDLDKF